MIKIYDDSCPRGYAYFVSPKFSLVPVALARIGREMPLDERINERGDIERSRENLKVFNDPHRP